MAPRKRPATATSGTGPANDEQPMTGLTNGEWIRCENQWEEEIEEHIPIRCQIARIVTHSCHILHNKLLQVNYTLSTAKSLILYVNLCCNVLTLLKMSTERILSHLASCFCHASSGLQFVEGNPKMLDESTKESSKTKKTSAEKLQRR